MKSMTTLEADLYIPLILERLREINPAKVILFGSHAQGTASAESDLDLLVVTHHDETPQSYGAKEEIYLEVARLLRDIRTKVPMDLVVHTRPMHARFIEMDSLFARELLQKGVVLYESDHS
jgi:uncharacterized protein